jgi:DNA-binding NtrC family response regulator
MSNAPALEPPGTHHGARLGGRRLRYRTDLPFKVAKRELVEPFERTYVVELLGRYGLNLSAASRASGLSRKHLRHLMRKYGLATERVLSAADGDLATASAVGAP